MVNLKISFFHKYILSQFVNSVHVAVDLYRLLFEVKLNIHNYSDLDQKQILPLSLSVVNLVIHVHVKNKYCRCHCQLSIWLYMYMYMLKEQ